MAKRLSAAEMLKLAEAVMFEGKRLSAAEMDELLEIGQMRALTEIIVWKEIELLAGVARGAVATGQEVTKDIIYKRLYNQLLSLSCPRLAPEVRNALMKVLGRSPRRQKGELEAVAVTLQYLIENEKDRMKKDGERPRGGPHEAALAEVARRQGMTVDALKKHLQRHRPRPKK